MKLQYVFSVSIMLKWIREEETLREILNLGGGSFMTRMEKQEDKPNLKIKTMEFQIHLDTLSLELKEMISFKSDFQQDEKVLSNLQ